MHIAVVVEVEGEALGVGDVDSRCGDEVGAVDNDEGLCAGRVGMVRDEEDREQEGIWQVDIPLAW